MMLEEDCKDDARISEGLPPPTDNEKKVRREIANSNERRRMQSINAGFQSLRTLLPHHEGEKLSKASILQQTAEYIYSLEQEKTRLLSQNCQLKRLLSLSQQRAESSGDAVQPKKKRFSTEGGELTESQEDGVITASTTALDPETSLQLLQERQMRQQLEARVRSLETELASSRILYPKFRTTLVPDSKKEPKIIVKEESRPTVIGINPPASSSSTVSENNENIDLLTTTTVLLRDDDRLSVGPTITIPSGEPGTTQTIYLKSNNADRLKPDPVERVPRLEPAMRTADKTVQSAKANDTSEQIISTDPLGQRSYIVTTNNSRQNLDSIVEAIRHLEGDHLFSSEDVGGGGNLHQVVKEEIVESVTSQIKKETPSSSCDNINVISSTDNERRLTSTNVVRQIPSSSVALPASSNNIIILKQVAD